jgi:flagellar hook-associated protein 2
LGSPITFSGFNSIDFTQILNAVMAQERTPLTRLETQKSTLQTQNTAFGTLAGKLSSLETAINTLKAEDSLALLSATSTDDGVGVSTASGTVTGTYDIVVSALAKAQVTTSSSTYAATTDVVATGGTFTLTPAVGAPTVLAISASTTLEELADAINASSTSPAAASVVQTSPGVYRLVLTGKDTGTTNAFTITNGLTGGTPPVFVDTDIDGVSGDSAADNTQQASNASLTINGLAVTSATNTVADAVPGATLTLTKADAATTVTVSVSRNATGAKDTLKKFITAFNDVIKFSKDQDTAAVAGRASIGRDPVLRSLANEMRQAARAEYTGGDLDRLAAIGLGFDSAGKMVLDETVFDEALETSQSDVQTLVSGAAGDAGAFGGFSDLIVDYTEAGGLVGATRTRIDTQLSAIDTRLDTLSQQLELRRLALQREFTAADLAMTRLKSQSSSLSTTTGGFRLF